MFHFHFACVGFLIGVFPFSAVQESGSDSAPSLEERVDAIRAFPSLHNGLRLEGSGSTTETQNGRVMRTYKHKFEILTNKDGSYRHFTLDDDFQMASNPTKTYGIRHEGFYDASYGLLHMNYSVSDGKRDFYSLSGRLKTFRPGNLGLVRQSGALGIIAIDQDTIDLYFPADVTPVQEALPDGCCRVVSTVPGLGKCIVNFGPKNEIIGYSVEKGSEDTVELSRKQRLKEWSIFQDESLSSYRVDVSDIKYSGECICNCKSVVQRTGVNGSQQNEEGEYSFKVVGSVGPLDSMPAGLSMLREYSDKKELMIGIRDDPHVRYIPDENGRVRKAIDRRGFDSRGPGTDRSDNGETKPPDIDNGNDGIVYENYLRTHIPSSRTIQGHST